MSDRTPDTNLWIETMVASRTGEPYVVLRWYDHSTELTPKEARDHALAVLAAADAAESDAFFVDFLKKTGGMELQEIGVMLQALRRYRDEREEPTDA